MKRSAIVKKITILLSIIMILSLLWSCNNPEEPRTSNTEANTNDISKDETSDTSSKNTDLNNDDSGNIQCEYTPNITTIQKQSVYYKELSIENGEYLGNDIPEDENSYFKIIQSYEELNSLVSNSENVDSFVFDDNYVVALNFRKNFSHDSYSIAGFYNIEEADNEITISVDYYSNSFIVGTVVVNVDKMIYLIVPKTKIAYNEGIKAISLTEQHLGRYQGEYTFDDAENSLENTTAWYFTTANQITEARQRYSLPSFIMEIPTAIIYLKEPITQDFVVNDCYIENGELYITIQLLDKYDMFISSGEVDGNGNLINNFPNGINYILVDLTLCSEFEDAFIPQEINIIIIETTI